MCEEFLVAFEINLRPRGFRPCEAMWLKLGQNSRSSIKNRLTQTDSALNADQKLSKNEGDPMLQKSADITRHT